MRKSAIFVDLYEGFTTIRGRVRENASHPPDSVPTIRIIYAPTRGRA